MCAELIGNPHCAPGVVTGMLALFLVLVVSPIATQIQDQHTVTQDEGGLINDQPISVAGKLENDRIYRHGCASHLYRRSMPVHTYAHNANNTVCSCSLNKTDCRETQESVITLSENGPQACFRLRNRNFTVGSMEVRLQHVFLTCNPVVLFYTRDVDIITEFVKRCHLAGTSQTCSHISSRSEVPELRNKYDFPGITRCTTSCGGLGCGCLLPTPGCLFSRTYAKPRNNKIYQVFHCPTWQESALMTFTYTGAQGTQGSDTFRINTQTTHVMQNANVTLEFVTAPAIPFLDTDGQCRSYRERYALRCPTMRTLPNITECHVEDRCSCSPSETEAKCDCRSLDVITKMASIDSRLPLSSSVLHLRDDLGLVFGAVHSAVIDFTISTSALYHADSIIDSEACDITSSPLQGCYNCLRGAEVTFSCHSSRPSMVEIEYQQKIFAAACGPSTAQTKVAIHAAAPNYKDRCLVKCGQKMHNITISGILAFHTHCRTPFQQHMIEHANYVNMFNYPDLGHLLDVAFQHWKTFVITCIAVAILIVNSATSSNTTTNRLLKMRMRKADV
ncbi:hypothetical protein COOONC_00939 [Cooperia oncophora]